MPTLEALEAERKSQPQQTCCQTCGTQTRLLHSGRCSFCYIQFVRMFCNQSKESKLISRGV